MKMFIYALMCPLPSLKVTWGGPKERLAAIGIGRLRGGSVLEEVTFIPPPAARVGLINNY